MSAARQPSDLLMRLEGVSARESLAQQCLLRLRAIGQRARLIDDVSSQAWEAVVAERQEIIDRLSSIGWPPNGSQARTLVAGADSDDARVRGAAAQARRAADGNATLLAEIVALDADVERQLADQIDGLAEQMARAERSGRVRAAYQQQGAAQPRFLDRRK